MKNKIISLISGLSLVGGLTVGPAAFASNTADVSKAASRVAKAAAADKQSVAIAVVKAYVGSNPAIATDIVSALARQNPSLAPVVAVTAVTLQHKQIGLITKAATSAAPSEAANIVDALMKEFPKDYGIIAVAAAEGAPAAGREILAVIAKYVPALEAFVQSATANVNLDVPAIIVQTLPSGVAYASVPQPTQPGAPVAPSFSSPTITQGGFQAFLGSPGSYTPGEYVDVPAGGRHYAQP